MSPHGSYTLYGAIRIYCNLSDNNKGKFVGVEFLLNFDYTIHLEICVLYDTFSCKNFSSLPAWPLYADKLHNIQIK